MAKRAVIYVRTSSEQQGEKCSPVEQESDCRRYADGQGLVVVNVYRDIERYRVKNKWVEPSGTRYDRPGLLAMLRDAADDQFDVIIAWREDRLYRGMRAMLLVLETIQQNKITIQLALETFDPATAPLKAWLAQVELENIKERMTMGVKARLKAGKANSGQDRYGYRRVGERIEVVPEEAEWVRQIFAWYNERIPLKEIRKRLIAADAPQKETTAPRKITWSESSIHGILAGAKDYVTGTKVQRREGDRFEIQTEPILDRETYERFLQVRKKFVNTSPPEVKQFALAKGLIYCACGYCWSPHQTTSHYFRSSEGEWVKRKVVKGTYVCGNRHDDRVSPQCPQRISRIEADREIWRQVCNAINHPEILLDKARTLVNELQSQAHTTQEERERIQKELENIFFDRQWTITQARVGNMSEEQMERTLNEYSQMEVALKNELTTVQELDDRLLVDWESKVKRYLEDLQDGIQGLNAEPANEEEWLEAITLKQHIVQLLVERVDIDVNRQLTVTIHLNLLELLEESLKNGGEPGEPGPWPSGDPPRRSNPARKHSLFSGRSGFVSVSAIWKY